MAWYRCGGGGSVTPQVGIPFICSDAKQYFALPNIYGDDDYRYEFKLIVPSEQQSLIFGGNWNVSAKLLHTYGSNLTYYMTNSPTQIPYTCWDIMDIEASTTYIKVNGTPYTSASQARGHELIYLFGFSNGYKSSIGISEFKIYDNSDDSLVMDLVPRKNSSTGAGYFHDTVGDDDYYSESGYDFAYVTFDGGSDLVTKSITANGTYNAIDDGVDGYSEVTVNVASGNPNAKEIVIIHEQIS